MNSLYARLASVMFLIVMALGLAFYAIARLATDTYYNEITQQLNHDIAAHVSAEQPLIVDGEVLPEALHAIAHFAMVINPSTEVYLLDTSGRILGHAAPPGRVARSEVALEPVRRFIAGTRFPLKGDDPRDSQRQKVFSAAEVKVDGELAGYVYIILGGEKYDAIASSLAGSYTLKLSLAAIVVSIALATLIGLILFRVLTKRLRRLSRHISRFPDSDLHTVAPVPVPGNGGDELDQLAGRFNAMSTRIAEQVVRLEETDQLRRELVTNVSHDLRTPLASMQGYIETLLIRNGTLDAAERRRYLHIAHKHGERLSCLIDELFELAKLDSGNMEPQLESFSLTELLHDVGQEFQLKATERDVSLAIEAPREDRRVHADIGLVQRALENLIENALRHTPDGGCVRISMAQQPDRVGVTVADTGCGIEAEAIPHIFDRFYRTGSQKDGTGLGLAIVKKIVNLHGGQIVVESEPGNGTRFTFDLPAGSAAA